MQLNLPPISKHVNVVAMIKEVAFSVEVAALCCLAASNYAAASPPPSFQSLYIGCFTDDGSRDLVGLVPGFGSSALNHESCRDLCKDYAYFALQYGGYCSCDDTYATPPASPTTPASAPNSQAVGGKYMQVPDAHCNISPGGGVWRNEIYHTKAQSTSLCAQGSFIDESAASGCSLCEPGQYQPDGQQATCLQCAKGSFTSLPGQSECSLCAPGSFTNEPGQSECSPFAQVYNLKDIVTRIQMLAAATRS